MTEIQNTIYYRRGTEDPMHEEMYPTQDTYSTVNTKYKTPSSMVWVE